MNVSIYMKGYYGNKPVSRTEENKANIIIQCAVFSGLRQKNGQDALKTAFLADKQIAPRGFEPLLPG